MALEAHVAKWRSSDATPLSPQLSLDCDHRDNSAAPAVQGFNLGCRGGDPEFNLMWIARNGGTSEEKDYRYKFGPGGKEFAEGGNCPGSKGCSRDGKDSGMRCLA